MDNKAKLVNSGTLMGLDFNFPQLAFKVYAAFRYFLPYWCIMAFTERIDV